MAGNSEEDSQECAFVWDEASQLYFHASTGFYHDPNAGWYYNSADGIYYKFEDGNYVPLQSDTVVEGEATEKKESAKENTFQDESCSHANVSGSDDCVPSKVETCGGYFQEGNQPDNSYPDCNGADSSASEFPPPPSEWFSTALRLEDTLIKLYLSNYSNPINETNAHDVVTLSETSDRFGTEFPTNVDVEDSDDYELEEGEWIPEEDYAPLDSGEAILHEEECEEENWKAQYGQVVPPSEEEEKKPSFHCTDLWDWRMVRRSIKKVGGKGKIKRKGEVVRLVGRPLKQSAKVHPSVPAGGGILRTAPIWQVHLDLVRVKTGQIYKLRTPSARHLATLTCYDSSNPTKDWGFPEISVDVGGQQSLHTSDLSRVNSNESVVAENGGGIPEDFSQTDCQLSESAVKKVQKSHGYRDRAAERRNLHGGFGIGPGQKKGPFASEDGGGSSPEDDKEAAAAEALDMSFGDGSYARKVLENMGWKQGEGLGSSKQGLREPIQPVGNIGSAGLGWPQPLGGKRRR